MLKPAGLINSACCCLRCTLTGVLQWLKSAATPGTPTTSYRASSPTSLFILRSSANGCPIPPAAPRSATLYCLASIVVAWRAALRAPRLCARRGVCAHLCTIPADRRPSKEATFLHADGAAGDAKLRVQRLLANPQLECVNKVELILKWPKRLRRSTFVLQQCKSAMKNAWFVFDLGQYG